MNKYFTPKYPEKLAVCLRKSGKDSRRKLLIQYIEKNYYESFEFAWRNET